MEETSSDDIAVQNTRLCDNNTQMSDRARSVITERCNLEEEKVLKAVAKFGESMADAHRTGSSVFDVDVVIDDIRSCDQDMYLAIREKFRKRLGLPKLTPIPKSKSTKAKGTPRKAAQKLTGEQMAKNNDIRKLLKEYNQIHQFFENTSSSKQLKERSQVVDRMSANTKATQVIELLSRFKSAEMKIVGLMHLAQWHIEPEHSGEVSEESRFEVYYGLLKISESTKESGAIGKSIAIIQRLAFDQCPRDLESVVKRMAEKFEFSVENLLRNYPKTALSNPFDNVFPSIFIKPYDSQMALCRAIVEDLPAFVIYNAKIASGKTTAAAMIASFLQTLNRDRKMIFAACNSAIIYDVCRMLTTLNIPWTYDYVDTVSKKQVRTGLVNADVMNPVVYTCTFDAVTKILDEMPEIKFTIFLDEPVYGADVPNHPATNAISRIYAAVSAQEKQYHSQLILSSASMPGESGMQPQIEDFQNKWPNAKVTTVTSSETFVGMTVICNQVELVVYANCKTRVQLERVISFLQFNQLVDRMVPVSHVTVLLEKLSGFIPAIKLEDFISSTITITQTAVKDALVLILKRMCLELTDIQIEQVCNRSENITEEPTSDIDMITARASEIVGGCIRFSQNPMVSGKLLYEQYCDRLGLVPEKRDNLIVELYREYTVACSKDKERLKCFDRKQSSRHISEKTRKKATQKGDTVRVEKNDQEIATHREELASATFKFPSEFRINSADHYVKFATEDTPVIVQTHPTLASIPNTLNVPDWVMFMLFCGIGIYTKNSLSDAYNDYVLSLFSSKNLAMLITDESLSCGVNYPVSTTILDDSFAAEHTMSSNHQAMGRAGRRGMSYTSKVFVGPEFFKRIRADLANAGDSEDHVEQTNIATSYNTIKEKLVLEKAKAARVAIVAKFFAERAALEEEICNDMKLAACRTRVVNKTNALADVQRKLFLNPSHNKEKHVAHLKKNIAAAEADLNAILEVYAQRRAALEALAPPPANSAVSQIKLVIVAPVDFAASSSSDVQTTSSSQIINDQDQNSLLVSSVCTTPPQQTVHLESVVRSEEGLLPMPQHPVQYIPLSVPTGAQYSEDSRTHTTPYLPHRDSYGQASQVGLQRVHPSSFVPHHSSFVPHHSSFVPYPSSFVPHPSSFVPHSFYPHPSFQPQPYGQAYPSQAYHGRGFLPPYPPSSFPPHPTYPPHPHSFN
jgi:hypothetical protein